ncbi:MAG: PDZ domain-containing protein [Candidatus Dadabacteria bacterium]|nr:PDZ domain-containing protein [Candidatus Dadabacteria bacterium]NIQ16980.1 PDZ domain-containing protein [Candidatus Dadabacteria bacterium]
MGKLKYISVLLISITTLVFSVSLLSAKEESYKGLANFSKVLYLIEKNYVEDISSEDLTINAIEGMLRSLDPYSVYLTPDNFKDVEVGTSGRFGGVGVEITIKNGLLTVISPIEDGPAEKAGVKAGDIIEKIEDETTKDFTTRKAANYLRGPKGSVVNIEVRGVNDKNPRKLKIVRDIIKIKSVKSKIIDNEYGYIKLSQFNKNSTLEFTNSYNKLIEKKGSELEGLILDLRNNPGGLLNQAIQLSDLFMNSGLIVSVKGRFEHSSKDYFAEKNNEISDVPLVIIVNKGSASASEILAGALKDSKRAKVVGTKTFGKGSVQSIIELDDGAGIKITTAKFYTPSGQTINEIGITPDVIVENNNSSKDKQLDRAVELIKQM